MNPQIWWYLARASGIVAFVFIATAVLWGIFLSTDVFEARRRPAWLLDVHRALGGLSLVAIITHLGALVADSYVHFDLVDILVPFASDWKPWPVALGVVAFWGLVAVEATSYAMRRLSKRTWRAIHLTSYVTFVLACLHGTFSGTDATNKAYAATSIVATLALVFATSYRILTRRPSARRPASTLESSSLA